MFATPRCHVRQYCPPILLEESTRADERLHSGNIFALNCQQNVTNVECEAQSVQGVAKILNKCFSDPKSERSSSSIHHPSQCEQTIYRLSQNELLFTQNIRVDGP